MGAKCKEMTSNFSHYVEENIEAGETYSAWVVAVNKAGEGDSSETHQVTVSASSTGLHTNKSLRRRWCNIDYIEKTNFALTLVDSHNP